MIAFNELAITIYRPCDIRQYVGPSYIVSFRIQKELEVKTRLVPRVGCTKTPSAKASKELGTTHSISLSHLTHSWGLVRFPMGWRPVAFHFIVSNVVSPWHMTASRSMWRQWSVQPELVSIRDDLQRARKRCVPVVLCKVSSPVCSAHMALSKLVILSMW